MCKRFIRDCNKWLEMKFAKVLVLAFIALFLIACKPQATVDPSPDKLNKFESKEYGFSFSYPSGWNVVDRDLPQRWALVDESKNTILFIVNEASTNDLLSLGRLQALSDMYPDETMESIEEEKLNQVFALVRLEKFNGKEWYTYGLKFFDKEIDSLISGTVCGNNHVLLVLVSGSEQIEQNREIYLNMLNSFEC